LSLLVPCVVSQYQLSFFFTKLLQTRAQAIFTHIRGFLLCFATRIRSRLGALQRYLRFDFFGYFLDEISCEAVEVEFRIAYIRFSNLMNLLRNSIEDFIGQAVRIGATVPGKYFCEVLTKLDVDRSYVTIGIEPGENLIETLGWNCRVSRHSESSLQFSHKKAQKHKNKKEPKKHSRARPSN